VIPIPFTLRRAKQGPPTYVRVVTTVNGLIGLEDAGLVLQYREKILTQGWPPSESESEVRVAHIPLAAIRRAELRRGWFRTRLILFAAELQAFESFRAWLRGSELALTIPRAERAAAADLASSIELALSTRLLYPGG
jgi:hypothetical protein